MEPAKREGKQLNELVKEKIDSITAEEVQNKVVETLAAQEVQVRHDAVITVSKKLQQARSALNKIQPDVKTFDKDGKQQLAFSETQQKAKIEANDQVMRLSSALDAALQDNKWDKLKEYAAKGDSKQPQAAETK